MHMLMVPFGDMKHAYADMVFGQEKKKKVYAEVGRLQGANPPLQLVYAQVKKRRCGPTEVVVGPQ